jgi:hypothetical protein
LDHLLCIEKECSCKINVRGKLFQTNSKDIILYCTKILQRRKNERKKRLSKTSENKTGETTRGQRKKMKDWDVETQLRQT